MKLKTPNIYYLNTDIISARSEDYADYYRYTQSTGDKLLRDELFSCVSYMREGECIEYREENDSFVYNML